MRAVASGLLPPIPPRPAGAGSAAPRSLAVAFPAPVAADTLSSAFWDYQSLFLSQRRESPRPTPLRLAEGSLPGDLPRGTYYLAGPGIFADDHGSTVSPLDGHGYLRAFRFGGEAVSYSARYVSTEAQREERDAGTGAWRFTYRGTFSVLRGGRRVGNAKVMKNVANTGVVRWGGKLICLWEGGEPYEIDPATLETVGPLDLVGQMEPKGRGGPWGLVARAVSPILHGLLRMPRQRVLSHYKIDATRRRLMVLCCDTEDMILPRSNFTFFEYDEDFKLVHRKHFSIADHLMIHDWAFTDNNYIIIGNRIRIDIPGSLLAASGLSPMISALSSNPSRPTTPVYILPRFTEEPRPNWRRPVEVPEQMWTIHMCNAFERRGGGRGPLEIELQATTCSYQWFHFHKLFGYNWENGRLNPLHMNIKEEETTMSLPHLVKVSIKIDDEGNVRECLIRGATSQSRKACDFPVINRSFSGREHAYTYVAMASGARRFLPYFPFDSIAKVRSSDGSTTSWMAGHRSFVGEPVFVPKGSLEDHGYILVVEYAVAEQRCYLVILDASCIGEPNGVVAKLEIPKDLTFPLGFHGFWDGE